MARYKSQFMVLTSKEVPVKHTCRMRYYAVIFAGLVAVAVPASATAAAPAFTPQEVADYIPKGPTQSFRHICLEYNSPCRPRYADGVFFDPDNLREYFSEADPVAYAEFCRSINLDGVLLLAVPEGGYTTYLQTQAGEPYPYLKENSLDFFGEVVRECHRRDISVFGYICIGWNKKAQRDFPHEFPAQHGGKGFEVPTLNGAFADQVIEYAREVLRHYPVDGLRTDILDHNTRARTPGDLALYRELYGEELPAEYPSWQREQAFRLASISRFVRRFYRACKEVKPTVEVWHNWFNYKNVVDLRDTDVVDISYEEFADPFSTLFVQGIFGSEAMISGKLLQNPQRRLCLVLNGRAYDYFPVNKRTGLTDQPLIELFQAGKGYYGENSARWVPPGMAWFHENLSPFYAEVAAQLPYLARAKPASRLAVIYSEATRFRFPGWKREAFIDPLEELTSCFLDHNEPLEFIAAHHLGTRKDLSTFQLILVPDMTGFTADQLHCLREYARKGGTLLLTGVATLFDEHGQPRPDFALADEMGLHFRKLQAIAENPTNTWLWRNTDFEGHSAVLASARIGEHTLHFWMREADVVIDQVVLTTDTRWRPPAGSVQAHGIPSDLVVIEPEASTQRVGRHGRRWENDDQLDGFGGSGYIVSRGAPHLEHEGYQQHSALLSVPVTLEKTGDYQVWVRFHAGDGASDSVFVGLDQTVALALDLDAIYRHKHDAPIVPGFGLEALPGWDGLDCQTAAEAPLVETNPVRGQAMVTLSRNGQIFPLIHVTDVDEGRVAYLATSDLPVLTAAVIRKLAGPSPVQVLPANKRAYLTRQYDKERWVLHLMDSGDCTVTIHPSLAPVTTAVDHFPVHGWQYELQATSHGLRIHVSGEAQGRLVVLQ